MAPYVYAFLSLIIVKSFIEPLAASIGRKLIERYVEEACGILDTTLEMVGLDFDPEQMVRDYLAIDAPKLSESETKRIVEAVFREWDLRQVACHNKNS